MGNIKKSYYTIFPSLFIIFVALIPLMSILSDVVKLTSLLFFVTKIVYVVILFLLLIVNVVLFIVLGKNIISSTELKSSKKVLLIFLLILFNLIVMPYFNHKYVVKDIVKPNNLIIYFIAIVFLAFVFAFGTNVYNKKINEEKAKQKEEEAKRITYTDKTNNFSFDFKLGYKQKEVGEYDLYVKNSEKNIILSAFTYDISLYEQKSLDDYLNKGILDIENSKKNAKIYKEKEYKELEDRKVLEIVYEGNSENSSLCVYRITAISFNDKPGYVLFSIIVSLKEDYSNQVNEIDEIINSAKIVQN